MQHEKNRCPHCYKKLTSDEKENENHFEKCIYEKILDDDLKRQVKTTQGGKHVIITYKDKEVLADYNHSLCRVRGVLKHDLEKEIEDKKNIKVSYEAGALFRKDRGEGVTEDKVRWIKTKSKTLNTSDENHLDDFIEDTRGIIKDRIETFTEDGSKWKLIDVLSHRLNIVKANALKGEAFLPLSSKLQKRVKGWHQKMQIINPENKDDYCILWNLAIYLTLKRQHSDFCHRLLKLANDGV